MANITETKSGHTAGVWASCDNQTVGIVAQEGTGPYLCFYGQKNGHIQSFPALAIFVGQDGKAKIQLPGPDGSSHGVRQINIEDLVKAAGLLDNPKPLEAAAPPAE